MHAGGGGGESWNSVYHWIIVKGQDLGSDKGNR